MFSTEFHSGSFISETGGGLQRLRDIGRPFETHNATTRSWELMPYPISPVTWFTFYHALRNFAGQSHGALGQLVWSLRDNCEKPRCTISACTKMCVSHVSSQYTRHAVSSSH